MIQNQFDRIEKGDIESLVAGEVREGRTIDYKQGRVGDKDSDRKEFLADVSSFANASGGDLLFGVEERREGGKQTGIPEAVPGLAGIVADAEILRLENMLRDGIKPRLPGVRIRAVGGFSAGPVLVLRVPRSFAAPHMVTFQEHSKFYTRNSCGKYAMDVGEIRAAFALSEALPERLRRFREDRLARVVAQETPLPTGAGPWTVLHVMPVASLDPTTLVDLHKAERPGLCPLAADHIDRRFNFDGLLFHRSEYDLVSCRTYAQLFRSGAIEAVDARMLAIEDDKPKVIQIGFWERELIEKLGSYLALQRDLGLTPPVVVLLALIGVRGYHVPHGAFSDTKCPIDRDALLLPDLVIEDFSAKPEDVLRPAFDAVWQAAGWRQCLNYDQDGTRVRR
jgi:hypothetical protein